jgi:hypothetical protein
VLGQWTTRSHGPSGSTTPPTAQTTWCWEMLTRGIRMSGGAPTHQAQTTRMACIAQTMGIQALMRGTHQKVGAWGPRCGA